MTGGEAKRIRAKQENNRAADESAAASGAAEAEDFAGGEGGVMQAERKYKAESKDRADRVSDPRPKKKLCMPEEDTSSSSR